MDRITIAYETFGRAEDPTLLLIAGLGGQLISWDEDVCEMLAGRGWHVVRYDNRDAGLSTSLSASGLPDPAAVASGHYETVPYRLSDMAADAIGLLDHLRVDCAHLVGISMGGMIAQTIAIDHPHRVASLVSIMSTTGWAVAPPSPEAAASLSPPPVTSATDVADQAVAEARVTGSPGFPFDAARVRRRAIAAYERARNPEGTVRQLAAIMASPDRTSALTRVVVPTLVIHGTDDPLIGVEGGRATARAIPGARLELIDGMGHDLPVPLFSRLVDLVDQHAKDAVAARHA